MNQEELMFDLGNDIQKSIVKVKNEGLKKILTNFGVRVFQISSGNSLAFNVMNHGLRFYKTHKYWVEESTKIIGFDKNKPEHKEKLSELISKRFESELDDNYKLALKYVQNFRSLDKEFNDASYNQSLNSIVNIWTSFESTMRDLWSYCLDNYPKSFIHDVVNYQGSSEIVGIEGKNISISLLAKYDFNIANCLGKILIGKFDFTSANGIKKAFQSILDKNNDCFQKLNSLELNQLEIIRHLAVHNAGIIDADYLKRSCRENEILGEKLNIPLKELRLYGDSCIQPTIDITIELDKKLTK